MSPFCRKIRFLQSDPPITIARATSNFVSCQRFSLLDFPFSCHSTNSDIFCFTFQMKCLCSYCLIGVLLLQGLEIYVFLHCVTFCNISLAAFLRLSKSLKFGSSWCSWIDAMVINLAPLLYVYMHNFFASSLESFSLLCVNPKIHYYN